MLAIISSCRAISNPIPSPSSNSSISADRPLPEAPPRVRNLLDLLPDLAQLGEARVALGALLEHQVAVLLLQLLELLVQLVMPGVQDADLEGEGRRGDEEVCEGEGAGE